MPEKEWPTSTVGPGCAAIARRAASDASCSEVRGFCTLVQLTPFCWRRAMTFDQQEPSANRPCTKTTFCADGECGNVAVEPHPWPWGTTGARETAKLSTHGD